MKDNNVLLMARIDKTDQLIIIYKGNCMNKATDLFSILLQSDFVNMARFEADIKDTVEDCKQAYIDHMNSLQWNNMVNQPDNNKLVWIN